MEFALLIHGAESAWAEMAGDERQDYFAAHRAFGAGLRESGVRVVYGCRLARPESVADAKPRDDGEPELGGMWILDVPSEDEAVAWAERLPLKPGDVVELRLCEHGG
ncbi:YciI family protein [Sphaerisporangium corydalis]|uniref:YciI family protein n=1 Tax=Sphaerisporangium corydalis TaxID=1441875 RepID=A0ABV9EJG8_9ACTN|nr:YciI family protein [Sphaerisporangium corydalis]